MFVTCVLTVASPIASWSAMFLFALPAAISRRTSISRAVKASSAACSARSAAISGGIRFCPACTARMVSRSSRWTWPFQDVGSRPSLKGPQHLHVTGVGGQNNNSGIVVLAPNSLDSVDAVEVRHLKIHERHVWAVQSKLF